MEFSDILFMLVAGLAITIGVGIAIVGGDSADVENSEAESYPLVSSETFYSAGECRTIVTLTYADYNETHTFDQLC